MTVISGLIIVPTSTFIKHFFHLSTSLELQRSHFNRNHWYFNDLHVLYKYIAGTCMLIISRHSSVMGQCKCILHTSGIISLFSVISTFKPLSLFLSSRAFNLYVHVWPLFKVNIIYCTNLNSIILVMYNSEHTCMNADLSVLHGA